MPRWFVDLIGVDYFGHVTYVQQFSSSKATDAEMAQVGRLTQWNGSASVNRA